jgi:hypothetical protein
MAGLGAVKQAASGRCVVLLELLGKNMGKRARAPGGDWPKQTSLQLWAA